MASNTLSLLTVDEVRALANRLNNRAQSPLGTDAPETARDMCLAAKVLRALVSGFDPNFPVVFPANGGSGQ